MSLVRIPCRLYGTSSAGWIHLRTTFAIPIGSYSTQTALTKGTRLRMTRADIFAQQKEDIFAKQEHSLRSIYRK